MHFEKGSSNAGVNVWCGRDSPTLALQSHGLSCLRTSLALTASHEMPLTSHNNELPPQPKLLCERAGGWHHICRNAKVPIALVSDKKFISIDDVASGLRKIGRYPSCIYESTYKVDGNHPGHAVERHAACLPIPSRYHHSVGYTES